MASQNWHGPNVAIRPSPLAPVPPSGAVQSSWGPPLAPARPIGLFPNTDWSNSPIQFRLGNDAPPSGPIGLFPNQPPPVPSSAPPRQNPWQGLAGFESQPPMQLQPERMGAPPAAPALLPSGGQPYGGGQRGGISFPMPNFGLGMVEQGFNQMGQLGSAIGGAFAGANALNSQMLQANRDRELERYLANLQSQTALKLAPYQALGGAGGPLATGIAGDYATQQTGINADLQRYLGQIGQAGDTLRQGTFDQQAGLAGRLQEMGQAGQLAQLGLNADLTRDVTGMNALAGLLGGGTFDQQANLTGGLAALDANRAILQGGTFGQQSDLARELARLGLAERGTFGEQADLQRYLGNLGSQTQLAQGGTFGQQANLAERLNQLQQGAGLEGIRLQGGIDETLARINAQRDLAQSGDFSQQAGLAQNLAGMQYGAGLEGLGMQNTAAQRLAELNAQRDVLTQGTFSQQDALQRALIGMTEGGRTQRAGLLTDALSGIFSNIPQINLPPINTGPSGVAGPYGEGASLMPYGQQQGPFPNLNVTSRNASGQVLMPPGMSGPPAPTVPHLRTTPPPQVPSFFRTPAQQPIQPSNPSSFLRTMGPESIPGTPYYRPQPVAPMPPGVAPPTAIQPPAPAAGGQQMPQYGGQGGLPLAQLIGKMGGIGGGAPPPMAPPPSFGNPYQPSGDSGMLASFMASMANRSPTSLPPQAMVGIPQARGTNPMTGQPILNQAQLPFLPQPAPARPSFSRSPVPLGRAASTQAAQSPLLRMLSGVMT